jgi:6,7-dimethyl-8-ribityllumazine synthase
MARRGHYAAVIALGLVVRGETAHFDYICNTASTGLSRVGLDTGVPCAFGVLTTENQAQAEARAGGAVGNAGADAADAAVAMINLIAEGR